MYVGTCCQYSNVACSLKLFTFCQYGERGLCGLLLSNLYLVCFRLLCTAGELLSLAGSPPLPACGKVARSVSRLSLYSRPLDEGAQWRSLKQDWVGVSLHCHLSGFTPALSSCGHLSQRVGESCRCSSRISMV